MSGKRIYRSRGFRFLVVGAFLSLSACSVEFLPDLSENDPAAGAGTTTDDGMPADNQVQIRFRSLTAEEAVDVGFHVAQGPLAQLPDDLFVADNMFGTGIGLGGNGRIAPGQEVIVQLPCSAGLTLGTHGGEFVDLETGEINGTGTQLWLQEGAQFSCASVIILEYVHQADEYKTVLLIGH